MILPYSAKPPRSSYDIYLVKAMVEQGDRVPASGNGGNEEGLKYSIVEYYTKYMKSSLIQMQRQVGVLKIDKHGGNVPFLFIFNHRGGRGGWG